MDPIQAFLQSLGAGTPGNGMPGGGSTHQASTPGAPGLPSVLDNYTNGPRIDPSEFQGGAAPGILGSLANYNLNPYARAMIAAAGTMQSTPTAANDTISPEMAGQMPQHPPSTGVFPGQWHAGGSASGPIIAPPVQGPLAMPARPTSMPAYNQGSPNLVSPPARTIRRQQAANCSEAYPPLPPQRPKGIDPTSVDLGHVPRFTTFHYSAPNSSDKRAPIYTALNLGGSS